MNLPYKAALLLLILTLGCGKGVVRPGPAAAGAMPSTPPWMPPGAVLDLDEVVEVSASGNRSCARRADGTVLCWGGPYEPLPTPVSGIDSAIDVATGDAHGCAVLSDGTVRCWGSDKRGRLGDGDNGQPSAKQGARTVVNLHDAVEVVVGHAHACARRKSGAVMCWGSNEIGQVGDDNPQDQPAPVPVIGLGDAVELTAGGAHSCARRATGEVVCWGFNGSGQLGHAPRKRSECKHVLGGTEPCRRQPIKVAVAGVVQLAAGEASTCARRANGTVVCWGEASGVNGYRSELTPAVVPGLNDATDLRAGGYMTCARRRRGTIVCWGPPQLRTIGRPLAEQSPLVQIANLGDATALTVGGGASGQMHACAVRGDRTVVCWGYRSSALGDGTAEHSLAPVEVLGLRDAVEIAAGNATTCARRAEGTILCWGGWGEAATSASPIEIASGISGQADTPSMAVWGQSGCARQPGAGVSCWGESAAPLAALRDVAELHDVAELAVGPNSLCARRHDDTLRCWGGGRTAASLCGDGWSGQQAPCTSDPGFHPPAFRAASGARLPGPEVATIAVGAEHGCALRMDGTVTCWGRRNELAPVPNISDAIELTAGDYRTCTRHQSGEVRCWSMDQLNEPDSRSDAAERTAIATLPGLVAGVEIALGGEHLCVRRDDGTVACGRIDLGPEVTLQPVAGLTGAVQLAAGNKHMCARLKGGEVACWGNNRAGQLGAGRWPLRRRLHETKPRSAALRRAGELVQQHSSPR